MFPENKYILFQDLVLNIVCAKKTLFVGTRELFDSVDFFLGSQGVVEPVLCISTLYEELFHLFIDRVTESVVETNFCQVLSFEDSFL